MMSTLSSLVNSFLLTCILTGSIWSVLRLTSRRILNAATRYTIWWIALLCALAFPNVGVSWKPHSRLAPPSAIYSAPLALCRSDTGREAHA